MSPFQQHLSIRMGCSGSSTVTPMATLQVKAFMAITIQPAQSKGVPSLTDDDHSQKVQGDPTHASATTAVVGSSCSLDTKLAEQAYHKANLPSSPLPSRVSRKVTLYRPVVGPDTLNQPDASAKCVGNDTIDKRSIVRSSIRLGAPEKGLGHIVECESILEASMKGEDDRSKSRATLLKQSSSGAKGESRTARMSLFKPVMQGWAERPKQADKQSCSSDSGIEEYSEAHNQSFKQMAFTHTMLGPLPYEKGVESWKTRNLPGKNYKLGGIGQSKLPNVSKLGEDSSRTSQRRSLTIDRGCNLGSSTQVVFSSESII